MEINSSLLNHKSMTFVKNSLINVSNYDKKQDFRVRVLEYIDDTADSEDDEFFYDMLEFVRFLNPYVDPQAAQAVAYTTPEKLIYMNCPNNSIGNKVPYWDFIYCHECLHQLWDTFEVGDRLKKNGIELNHFLLNVASDCVINDYLYRLRKKQRPKDLITPEYLKDKYGVEYDTKLDTQYTLYLKCLEHVKEMEQDPLLKDDTKFDDKIKAPKADGPSGGGGGGGHKEAHSDEYKRGWREGIKDVLDKKVDPLTYKPKEPKNDYDQGYNDVIGQIKNGLENGVSLSNDSSGGSGSSSDLADIPWDVDQDDQDNQDQSGESGKGDGDSSDDSDQDDNGSKSNSNSSSDSKGKSSDSDSDGGASSGDSDDSDLSKMNSDELASNASNSAKDAKDAADKAKQKAAASGDAKDKDNADKAEQAAKDAEQAAKEAKDAADKGDKDAAKKAAKHAKDAANKAKMYSDGNGEEGGKKGKEGKDGKDSKNKSSNSKGGTSGTMMDNINGHMTDADIEDIKKRATETIEKYKNKISGDFGDFIKKCSSSVKCEENGLAIKGERGTSGWNNKMESDVIGYVKRKIFQKMRMFKQSYSKVKRGSGVIEYGKPLIPGKKLIKQSLTINASFYVDVSGSMAGCLEDVFEAVYSISESLKNKFGKNKIVDNVAFKVHIFDTSMLEIDFGKRIHNPRGGTMPFQQLVEEIEDRSKNFLINIVITDGEFSDMNEGQAKKFIDKIEGMIVYISNQDNDSNDKIQKLANNDYKGKLFFIKANGSFKLNE